MDPNGAGMGIPGLKNRQVRAWPWRRLKAPGMRSNAQQPDCSELSRPTRPRSRAAQAPVSSQDVGIVRGRDLPPVRVSPLCAGNAAQFCTSCGATASATPSGGLWCHRDNRHQASVKTGQACRKRGAIHLSVGTPALKGQAPRNQKPA